MRKAALSKREMEVVQGVWDGLTAKEIGQRLGISDKTVKQHQFNIHQKWGVTNVAQLLRKAIESGMVKV